MIQSNFTIEEALNHNRGTEFNEVAAGTSAGATATKATATGVRHKIQRVHGHTDKDSLLQLKDGTTVVWETTIDVDVDGKEIGFDLSGCPIIGTAGNAVSAVLASSTTDCYISIGGYSDKSI